MIEEAVLRYLRSDTELVSLLGTSAQIDVGQVAQTEKMPWLIINVSVGTRDKISQTKTEQRSTLRITVHGGPQHKVKAKSIAEKALRLLENYRGAMYSLDDVHITCNAINGNSGFGNSIQYQFLASVRFTEAYEEPSI